MSLTPEQYREHNDRLYGSLKSMYWELFRHYEAAVASGDIASAQEKKRVLLETFDNTADDNAKLSALHFEMRFKAEQSAVAPGGKAG